MPMIAVPAHFDGAWMKFDLKPNAKLIQESDNEHVSNISLESENEAFIKSKTTRRLWRKRT